MFYTLRYSLKYLLKRILRYHKLFGSFTSFLAGKIDIVQPDNLTKYPDASKIIDSITSPKRYSTSPSRQSNDKSNNIETKGKTNNQQIRIRITLVFNYHLAKK